MNRRYLISLIALLLIGYAVGAPHRPGSAGVLLDADGDTYLEFDQGEWSEGFLDPHQTLTLFYCESNGWFRKPTRTKLWVGGCECTFSLDEVKFLPRSDAADRCIRIQVPVSGTVTPRVFGISQNGNQLTYCL